MPSRLMGGGRGAGDPAGEGRADMMLSLLLDAPDARSLLSSVSDPAVVTSRCVRASNRANSDFGPVDNSGDWAGPA